MTSVEWFAVGAAAEIASGRTKKFVLRYGERELEAFVLNHEGQFVAFVNRCRHVPMTMDWIENQFTTEDGAFIQCATHGALYEPESGRCVAGPALGKSLVEVPLEQRDGVLYARWPDGE